MEQSNLYVLVGAMVDTSIASDFKKKIGKAKTDEVIRTFIEMVAKGDIEVGVNENEDKDCDIT